MIYIYIYIHIYSLRYLSIGENSRKKNNLMKQKFCRCRPVTLKSLYCAKVHCSAVQTIRYLTKKYDNYCGVNNFYKINNYYLKLTVT
jgi:hypothetical protein